MSVVDGAPQHDATANGDGPTRPAGPDATDGSDPLSRWIDLVTQTLQAMARLSVPDAGPPRQPTGGPVWVDVVSGRGSGTLLLAVAAGAGATSDPAELWLHNPGAHPVGPLHLDVGELRTSDGLTLPSGAVSLDPASVLELPGRSSRGVSASIDAREPLAAGRYRGLLQADGADAVAVAVELTIAEPS